MEEQVVDKTITDNSSQGSWYVIHTYSTYEEAVRDNILKKVQNIGLQDKIFDCVVIFEEEITESKGKRKVTQKKKYPTYCFIKMIYDEHVYYHVTSVRGVTGFVGPGGVPSPLSPEEVRRMGLEKVKASDLGVQIGELVRIISGPFESYTGEITDIDEENAKVNVVLSMFGKLTPIVLEFNQIQKA